MDVHLEQYGLTSSHLTCLILRSRVSVQSGTICYLLQYLQVWQPVVDLPVERRCIAHLSSGFIVRRPSGSPSIHCCTIQSERCGRESFRSEGIMKSRTVLMQNSQKAGDVQRRHRAEPEIAGYIPRSPRDCRCTPDSGVDSPRLVGEWFGMASHQSNFGMKFPETTCGPQS